MTQNQGPTARSDGTQAATEIAGVRVKPRLRGVFHLWAFVLALPLGVALALTSETPRARAAAAVFASSVVLMFGASALYHCVTWTPARRLWARRLDHAGIFGLIAGTYTPVGLLVLDGAWRAAVLGTVWGGALTAILLKLLWPSGPRWISAVLGVALGWVAVVVFPVIFDRIGAAGATLLLLGGICYTVGAIIYARRRPDPFPAVFGYHEIFHVLVVVAVACQYAAVAFFVLH